MAEFDESFLFVDRAALLGLPADLTADELLVYLTARDFLAVTSGKLRGCLAYGPHPISEDQFCRVTRLPKKRFVLALSGLRQRHQLIVQKRLSKGEFAPVYFFVRDFVHEQDRCRKRHLRTVEDRRARICGKDVDKSRNGVDKSANSVENYEGSGHSQESTSNSLLRSRSENEAKSGKTPMNLVGVSGECPDPFLDNVNVDLRSTTTDPLPRSPSSALGLAAPPPVPTARVEVVVVGDGRARATEEHGAPTYEASVEDNALDNTHEELRRLVASRTEGRIVGEESDFLKRVSDLLGTSRERKSKTFRLVGTGGGAAKPRADDGERVSDELIWKCAARCVELTRDENPMPNAWQNAVRELLLRADGLSRFQRCLDDLSKQHAHPNEDARPKNAASWLMNRIQREARAA